MMLKKALSLGTLALVMGLSSQSFAASTMSCTVQFTYATKNGLMPYSKKIDMKNAIIEKMGEGEDYNCASKAIFGLSLQLCGLEDSEAQGVYHAVMTIKPGASYENMTEADFSQAAQALAMPKKAGAAMVSMQTVDALSPVLVKRLMDAGMDVPTYVNRDSAGLDEAVAEAVKKNVIDEGLMTTIEISQCEVH